jgi:hypothetical protein
MRIQLAILFVIAALLDQVLMQKVNATDVFSLPEKPSADHFIVMPASSTPAQPVIPITPPETLGLNEVAPKNSGTQINHEPVVAQNSSVYIVEPVNEFESVRNSPENPLVKTQPSSVDQTVHLVNSHSTSLVELAQDNGSLDNINLSNNQERLEQSSEIFTKESVPYAASIAEPEKSEIPVTARRPSQSIPVAEVPNPNIVHTSAQLLLSRTNSISQNSIDSNRQVPSAGEIQNLQNQLENIEERVPDVEDFYRGSPALTITVPSGFGADNNTGYIGASFVSKVRYSDESDGALFLGVGLGDAQKSVGVEVSYTLASLSGENTEFGRGGFNLKVHKQLENDWAIAAGWNGFLNIGDNDFENSVYGTATKVIRLKDSVQKPLSRLALTAGIGNGQFRSEDDIEDDRGTVNVFGSAALRVVEPVSLIAEWTGQDLAIGASIVPIKNFPWVITPALRDIAGAGDGARFVVGTGFAFQF